MIYPTRRAVGLMAAGAPVSLVLAVVAPNLWVVGVAWILAVLLLIMADAWLAPSSRTVSFRLTAPARLATVDAPQAAVLKLSFAGRSPHRVEATLQTNAKLTAAPVRARAMVAQGGADLDFTLAPDRRGDGVVERAWARWTGPLGLLHMQASHVLDQAVAVIPNIASAREHAIRLFSRDAFFGQKSQIELGDGSEFNALREFQDGMDLRSVDWRQSARHGALLSKEYKSERNHPVMLVIDSGRLMGEPIGGAPKLDQAINAALALGYVSLRAGDRIGLAAFDAKPRLISKTAAGVVGFPVIQQLAARIDYSAEETNFTLGLSAVAGALDRRALVVIFTDFADTTSAQLMLESAARLMKRHLVLFVLFEDEELESLARRAPPTFPVRWSPTRCCGNATWSSPD